MCMGGGGGGGFGGGGMGGGGFAGSSFGIGSIGQGMNMGSGGDTKLGIVGGADPTKTYDLANEGQKEFLGSTPGYDEDKLKALANKKGKSQLYVS